MFGFLEEIENLTGLPFEILKNGFRVINYSNKCVYVENYKSIISFSKTEVSLKISKGIVLILGENLKIKKSNISSIFISGKISSLKVE